MYKRALQALSEENGEEDRYRPTFGDSDSENEGDDQDFFAGNFSKALEDPAAIISRIRDVADDDNDEGDEGEEEEPAPAPAKKVNKPEHKPVEVPKEVSKPKQHKQRLECAYCPGKRFIHQTDLDSHLKSKSHAKALQRQGGDKSKAEEPVDNSKPSQNQNQNQSQDQNKNQNQNQKQKQKQNQNQNHQNQKSKKQNQDQSENQNQNNNKHGKAQANGAHNKGTGSIESDAPVVPPVQSVEKDGHRKKAKHQHKTAQGRTQEKSPVSQVDTHIKNESSSKVKHSTAKPSKKQ